MTDDLRTALVDLLHELEPSGIDIMLGGGFALFLKQRHLVREGTKTLISPERWPQARATNDIDLLLRPEIVTRSEQMRVIRDGLDRLGYEPVPGAEFYQFVKELGGSRQVKIDFLGGPLGEYDDSAHVSIDSRRIKPKPSVKLHAHRMDEAVAYDVEPIRVPLTGVRSNGTSVSCEVLVPQAFSYLMMKLFAFRDRKDDKQKEFAQHHALDIYRVVAMLPESEYTTVQRLAKEHSDNEQVRDAANIVSDFFDDVDAIGLVRMREHSLFSDSMEVKMLIDVLRELFPRSF